MLIELLERDRVRVPQRGDSRNVVLPDLLAVIRPADAA